MAELIDKGRERVGEITDKAQGWAHTWMNDHDDHEVVEVALQLYERDRDAFATVLGSALAFRLFLFIIPADIALTSLFNLLRIGSLFSSVLSESSATADSSKYVLSTSWWQSLGLFISFTVATMWAGRSLGRVLATCSAAAWGLPPRRAKVGLKGVAALTGLFAILLVSSLLLAAIRDASGFTVSLGTWALVAGSMMIGWFVISVLLPRGATDPGALIPGAFIVGVGFAGLQWFMHFYLPNKIARLSDTYGSVANSAATLGYFFFVGRMMVSSLVLDAVVYNRYGTVSHWVFQLPLIRAIPRRWPRLARYFGLDDMLEPAAVTPAAESVADLK